MRPIWKGILGFGLVTIPIRIYAATERKSLHFNQLHLKCVTPIRYLKWCPTCRTEVAPEEIGLGYEYDKGQYVMMEESDFERVPVPTTHTITISDFVDIVEIDPIFFDKTYFLEPAEGGFKAYHLLRQAMTDAGKVALGKVVLRSKESLVAVRVYRRAALALETMFFPNEVRAVEELASIYSQKKPVRSRTEEKERLPAQKEGWPEAEVDLDPRELEMAKLLITTLTGPFDPEKYRDAYTEKMLQIIEERAEGRVVAAAPRPEPAKVVDLMEALRRSVDLAKSGHKDAISMQQASSGSS